MRLSLVVARKVGSASRFSFPLSTPAPEPSEPKLGFPRARRITRTAEIERLLRSGHRVRARLLDVKRLDSDLGHVRVAIVVPKFGFSAVRRNKLKRQLRELVRLHVLSAVCSCDLIVRARRDTYGASFDRLRDDVGSVATQLA